MTNGSPDGLTSDASLPDVLRLPVRLWLVALVVVVAFVGGFLTRGLTQHARPLPASSWGQQAPPLSDDELQGALPGDHPTVSPTTGGAP